MLGVAGAAARRRPRRGLGVYLDMMAMIGAGMAAAFSPLMTGVLMRIPVADAADATGVIVTVNRLGLVVGVATFGTLYLNLAGALPAARSLEGLCAFRLAVRARRHGYDRGPGGRGPRWAACWP